MQERFLKSRGIAYRTNHFRPDRKTTLFVHGLSGSLSAWYPFEKLFEQEYNVVTFDLRGHGLSVRPGYWGYTLPEFVEDIRALVEYLRVERVTVVSHSFGTLIAMEFARANPELVERNIFLAPPYGVHSFGPTRVLAQVAAALALVPLRLRAYGRTNYAPFYLTHDFSPRRIFCDIAHMGLRSYLLALQVIFARNYDKDWQELTQPTLIIHGTDDAMVPVAQSRALAHALPHAQLVELAGANHIVVLNNIARVAHELQKFVGQ